MAAPSPYLGYAERSLTIEPVNSADRTKGTAMSEDTNVSKPTGDAPSPRRRDPQTMMRLINSGMAAVGTLYLATESVVVTVIGAAVAVVLVVLYLVLHRT